MHVDLSALFAPQEFDELLHSGELRTAARRPESVIHAAADAHVANLSVALRYAFAIGRKAIKPMLTSMRAAGGPGSGNFGHAGRPGEIGGSGSSIDAIPAHPARQFDAYAYYEAGQSPLQVVGTTPVSPAWTEHKTEVEFALGSFSEALTHGTVVEMLIDDISTYQTFVSKVKLRTLAKSGVDFTKPVGVVFEHGGRSWLVDGNHRTTVGKLQGRTSVKVIRVQHADYRTASAVESKQTVSEYVLSELPPWVGGLRVAAFNTDQPRDEQGQWTSGGGGLGASLESSVNHYQGVFYTNRTTAEDILTRVRRPGATIVKTKRGFVVQDGEQVFGPKGWVLRSASRATDLADQATSAMRTALDAVLYPTLLRVVVAGGQAGVALLVKQLRVGEFNPDQPRDEQGQWTNVLSGERAIAEKLGLPTSYNGKDSSKLPGQAVDNPLPQSTQLDHEQTKRLPIMMMGKSETVDISSLKSTQDYVQPSAVQHFKDGSYMKHQPIVATIHGDEVLLNGNHNVLAAKLRGEKTISVQHLGDFSKYADYIKEVDKGGHRMASHKFATTQVNLPPDLAAKFAAFPIADEDLAADGRELHSHITVKYGLVDASPDDVRDALVGEPPFTVTLGLVATFTGVEDGTADAVIVEVESADLVRLNKKIADAVETADTHHTYKPHATIAYVKLGRGKKYAGDESFVGMTATFDRVVFSGVDDGVHVVALRAAGFNPDQPRDEGGKWTSGGAPPTNEAGQFFEEGGTWNRSSSGKKPYGWGAPSDDQYDVPEIVHKVVRDNGVWGSSHGNSQMLTGAAAEQMGIDGYRGRGQLDANGNQIVTKFLTHIADDPTGAEELLYHSFENTRKTEFNVGDTLRMPLTATSGRVSQYGIRLDTDAQLGQPVVFEFQRGTQMVAYSASATQRDVKNGDIDSVAAGMKEAGHVWSEAIVAGGFEVVSVSTRYMGSQHNNPNPKMTTQIYGEVVRLKQKETFHPTKGWAPRG